MSATTFSPSLSASRPSESQTITLPDGRTLGYAEYGPPTGYPIIFFHGFPSSRLEAYPLDRIAHHRGLRILSLERPGFGISTFQPHRSLLDWPNDVGEFVEQKGLRRFAVLGASGGGPYAVACAKALPRLAKANMTAVGLFASGPPWIAGRQHMPWFARWSAWLVNSWPGGFRIFFGGLVGFAKWFVGTGPIVRRLDKFLEKSAEKEKAAEGDRLGMVGDEEYTTAHRRDRLLSLVLSEPFNQGIEGFLLETKLLSDPNWGFKFEDVEYGPIKIWHGSKDFNAPVQMIRYMAQRLPNATLTEFDDTHFTLAKHFSLALEELVSEQEVEKFMEDTKAGNI
ncbi:hypothetical protein ABW20_dc0100549 [Dactylellina cionopaga]|nr:hypothetical protein ABW20_dc0100549 [Dactylellina cionopaga]